MNRPKSLNFDGVWILGLFSGIVTIGRYGKWHQLTALCDANTFLV